MKPFDLKDKVVLITGASSGIGRATAAAFAREGARIALVSRDLAQLQKTADQIKSGNGIAEIFPLDLFQIEKIPGTINSIKQKLGSVDVLVNNAAYAVLGLVEDCPVDQYRKNFEVNFFAPIALIQSVLPDMKRKLSGQIINISSGVGRRALPGVSSYSATKFALNGLTESLRLEARPYGIDVVLIFPGRVETNFHERMESYGCLDRKLPPIPMQPPEKIAQLILSASRNRRREASILGPGWIGYHLNYWAPSLVDRLLFKKFPT
ncbi:MAG: SDR family NAD(P)-dependent oxidoreductase [Elusimicrobia bacterium]|nr:SDR family NAD(P)-dependent oxidoreductase [Elusimicrobiota bacterium]